MEDPAMADRSRASRWWLRLALALLGALCGIALSELALRVKAKSSLPTERWENIIGNLQPPPYGSGGEAHFGQLARRSEIPDLIYELKPNVDTVYQGVRVRTNSDGLRANAEYARPKPAQVYRLLLLGDSQTFGDGVELESTFGHLLEKELNRRAGGRRVEVLNAGVDGYSTGQEAAYFESRGITYQPDCVMILFIGNDLELADWLLDPVDPLTDRRSYLLTALGISPGSSAAEPKADRVPEAFRHLVGKQGYKDALRRIGKVARASSVPVINLLGGQARLAATPDSKFWLEVEQLQDELGIACPPFEFPWSPEWWISDQNRHLNAAGHQVLFQRALEALTREQEVWR